MKKIVKILIALIVFLISFYIFYTLFTAKNPDTIFEKEQPTDVLLA